MKKRNAAESQKSTMNNPKAARDNALKNVNPNDMRSWACIDAINRTYREYQKYQDGKLQDTLEGGTIEDKLADFDYHVQQIVGKRPQRPPHKGYRQNNARTDQKPNGPEGDEVDIGEEEEGEDEGRGGCEDKGDEDEKDKRPKKNFNERCHPENIWIEFAPRRADRHSKGIAWKETTSNLDSGITTGTRELHPPGWLIEQSSEQVEVVEDIKEYMNDLDSTNDVTEIVDDLHGMVARLVGGITKPEITRSLRWLPAGKVRGLDYRAFLLSLGDFNHAMLQHAMRHSPRKFKCRDDQSDSELYQGSDFDKEVEALFDKDKESGDTDTYFEAEPPPDIERDYEPPPYPIRGPDEYVPTEEREPMTQWRERVEAERQRRLEAQQKWAEDLCEKRNEKMKEAREKYKKQLEERRQKEEEERQRKEEEEKQKAETKKQLIDKFIEEGNSPRMAEKMARDAMKRQEQREKEKKKFRDLNTYTERQKILWTALFLGEMYEAKDAILPVAMDKKCLPHKLAPRDPDLYKAWREDRMAKEASAKSPYLDPLPLVNNRLDMIYRKTCRERQKECKMQPITSVAFDHWIIDAPPDGSGRIVITENQYRIRHILQYMASKEGSALAQLPRVELMFHFCHNLVDQLQGLQPEPPQDCEKSKQKTSQEGDAKEESAAKERNSDTPQPATSNAEEDIDPSTTPFKNPDRDKLVIGCHAQGELPKRNICKGNALPVPTLPRFKGSEHRWIQEYSRSLPKNSYFNRIRPKEDKIPYGRVRSVRNDMAQLHSKEWDAYNCRRYKFRKALWENMEVQNFPTSERRNRFAASFWALLPHDNRLPRPLLDSSVERAII